MIPIPRNDWRIRVDYTWWSTVNTNKYLLISSTLEKPLLCGDEKRYTYKTSTFGKHRDELFETFLNLKKHTM